MKAVLHHDIGDGIRRLIDTVDPRVVEIVAVGVSDSAGLAREFADAEVLLHVLAPVSADVMAQGPRLRLVHKIGVGVDAIDLSAARERGIAVCNMPGTNTQAVVELTLALMFASVRRIVALDAETHAGRGWPIRPDLVEDIGEIAGRCIGLIGFGAVSRRLTPVLRALGARVIAHDPQLSSAADVELMSCEDVLRQADVVSLHAPLTPETRNLLDARRIAMMKPGAIIINTARGPLVDQDALVDALKNGRIGAAALDVFPDEPPAAASPIFSLPNVVTTPHVAWLTSGTWQRSLDVVVGNCRRLAGGAPLLHRVV